jgi:CubicO group peptidase (beta-lactamase class C family)
LLAKAADPMKSIGRETLLMVCPDADQGAGGRSIKGTCGDVFSAGSPGSSSDHRQMPMGANVSYSGTARILTCCILATHTNIIFADDAVNEPTTREIVAHPDVQGALKAVDAWVEGVVIYEKIPGISTGIVHDQNLIWNNGYGYSNVARQRSADANTIYSICSISKLFTSIAVMQLRDAGKLDLGDAVADHLDWFATTKVHDERRPITIESLLTHTSGLRRNTENPIWNGPGFPFPTLPEIMHTMQVQSTAYPAQHLYHYSNIAFSIAGEIVHRQSGLSYQEYVKTNILDPLGLSDTRAYYPEELRGDELAIGYAGMGRSGTRLPLTSFDTRAFTPAAGLTSSVNDLGRFASWQFRLLKGGEDEVLNAGTLREMHRVHWIDPDREAASGIGFSVEQLDENTVVGHGGDCPGYVTDLSMIPKERIASVVLTNAGDGPATRISRSVLKVIAAAMKSARTPPGQVMPDLSMYEGNFDAADSGYGGEQAIRQWGDQLVSISIPSDDLSNSMTRLERADGHGFLSVEENETPRSSWIFEMADDGKAARFFQDGVYWHRID